jgi:very-short-patch-repair endonuclease
LRDWQRDEIIQNNGFEVLHIKEEEYRNNKEYAIKKCLEFLNV